MTATRMPREAVLVDACRRGGARTGAARTGRRLPLPARPLSGLPGDRRLAHRAWADATVRSLLRRVLRAGGRGDRMARPSRAREPRPLAADAAGDGAGTDGVRAATRDRVGDGGLKPYLSDP